MRASAIVVAAGSGTRLGSRVPKAFVEVAGRPMLAYSLLAIRDVIEIEEAVITIPAGMEHAVRAEAERQGLAIPIKITPGGVERQDSVRIALALTSADAEIVLVHDAARPFATAAMFSAAIEAARSNAAIVAVPLADTLKRVEDRKTVETVSRAGLWQAQTPQAFERRLLVQAHERAVLNGVGATDDAELVELMGSRVAVVDGSPLNLKITTSDDLRIADAIARSLFPR